MQKRNQWISMKLGKKILTGFLILGLTTGTPMSVLAEEETQTVEQTVMYARTTDGTESYVEVSSQVLELIAQGAIYFDELSGYLLDTQTGQKVNPQSGERVTESEAPGETETPEEGETPEESETPDENVTPEEGETPEESETPEEGETPGESERPDAAETPGESEMPDSTETPIETEIMDESVISDEAKSSNAELIANQKIVKPPQVVEDFRFWTVSRKYAFAKERLNIYEAIPENGEQEVLTRIVGTLPENGLLYILKEEDGWFYVESGGARGFVDADQVVTGDQAQVRLMRLQIQARMLARRTNQEYTGIETVAETATVLLAAEENKAYAYLRATVNPTVVDKVYGIADAETLNVRESQETSARIVGTLKKGDLCYILADSDEQWVYVESGDVRGFVDRTYLLMGEEAQKQVEEAGEDSFGLAAQIIEPEENQALYYTYTSVESGVPGGEVRKSIVDFASQFIGNSYVWGGTSLTNGADCSGFVQQIYEQYGYHLPRTSREQAQYGTQIPVEDALPGDLIFYAKEGVVYHVVLYAGDGKTIEAASTRQGIINGNVNTANAVWAVRVFHDAVTETSSDIHEVNATDEMYGEKLGNFRITYYCACELCCDVETGITATGAPVVEGRTIAVDPDVIPYGTQVIIGGHVFTAEDCGGAIKDNRIDIYVDSHEEALQLGVAQEDVYLVK